jgi:hypothetical protein
MTPDPILDRIRNYTEILGCYMENIDESNITERSKSILSQSILLNEGSEYFANRLQISFIYLEDLSIIHY